MKLPHPIVRVALGAALLAGLVGCGMAPEAPQVAKTADESPLISGACRSAVTALAGGPSLLNAFDVAEGADATGTFGPTQASTDLEAFTATARALGAEACG